MNIAIPSDTTITRRRFAILRAASLGAPVAVACVGALVLLGWALEVEVLKSLGHPGRVAMNPTTALAFILCAAALFRLRDERPPSRRRRVAQACAGVVIVVAALRILSYALDLSFGVDRILFRSRLGTNVMAPNTAATFLMVGVALLTLDVRTRRRGFHPAQALVIAAGCVALFSVTGYLYSSVTLYGVHGYIPMALNTALAFGFLCVGVLAARPGREPVATAVSDTLGGIVARRLIPAAFAVPLLLGWLRLVAQRRGWVGAETGLALFVLATILVFNGLIWWCARVLHMSDMRHRRSEEELRQSEQRHRAVMEQAAEGIYLVDLEHKRVIESNAALDRLLGYARGETSGRSVYEFVDDTRENVDGRLRRLSEATAPLHGERQYRHKDGRMVEVEVSATVIEYGDRRVACTVVHDITQRKLADRALHEKNRQLEEAARAERDALAKLRESEERHRVVVQQAAEGITLVDAETLRILEVNEAFARLVGYAPHEMIDRAISDFIVDTAAGVASRASQTLGAGTATAVQRQYRRKDGSVVDVEKSATVLTLSGRRVLCTVIHDVTDRNRAERELHEKHRQLGEAHEKLKQAQSRLVQSEKLASLGQMVAGVAHEINNPLAFVSNNVAVLERDTRSMCEILGLYARAEPAIARDDPALAAAIHDLADRVDLQYTTDNLPEMLARSRDGLKRIQQIVRDLRDFARLDESDRHEVDLNDGIASTVNIIVGRARRKRVAIEQHLGALPRVLCHPAKINQVVMNLLANAIDACPEGGRVEVASRVNGSGVEIEVSDNGPGIPPDIAGRIFDPFFTTKPVGEGTGLGLSISYGIVQDHGGAMDVTSEPGKGAKFVVRLPRGATTRA